MIAVTLLPKVWRRRSLTRRLCRRCSAAACRRSNASATEWDVSLSAVTACAPGKDPVDLQINVHTSITLLVPLHGRECNERNAVPETSMQQPEPRRLCE